MNQRLALPPRRMITPVSAVLLVIALAAVLALGFGLRAWTETGSSSTATGDSPAHQSLNARDEAARRTAVSMRRATTTATGPVLGRTYH